LTSSNHPVSAQRRIIGIDPGSRITGYGIIDSDGIRTRWVAGGVIAARQPEFPQRLGEIFSGLKRVVAEHAPEEMALEEVFMAKNAASALKLGQARGAAICAGVEFNLTIAQYSTRLVKQAIVGRGGADKGQVQFMIKRLLQLAHDPSSDEADAFAVAITHAHHQRLAQLGNRGWR